MPYEEHVLQEFDENVNKLKNLSPDFNDCSEEVYFGFKCNEENIVFSVVDFGNIKSFISSALKKQRELVEEEIWKILKRHTEWTPTCGYESDEEKGYQKGLIDEAKLIESEFLTDLKNKEI